MSSTIQDGSDRLEFVNDVSLADLAAAMKAYADLVRALTHGEPSYSDFTAFIQREGYAKKVV